MTFVLCSVAAGAGVFENFDRWTLQTAQKAESGALDTLGRFFSYAGSLEVVGVALISLLTILVFGGHLRLASRLLAAFVATGMVELAMKFFLSTPPLPGMASRATDPTLLVALEHPFPYPSGHALRLVLLFGAVFVLWTNGVARTVVVVGGGVAVLSRVYLGVHWASDVIGGALLGILGLTWVFERPAISGHQPARNDDQLTGRR